MRRTSGSAWSTVPGTCDVRSVPSQILARIPGTCTGIRIVAIGEGSAFVVYDDGAKVYTMRVPSDALPQQLANGIEPRLVLDAARLFAAWRSSNRVHAGTWMPGGGVPSELDLGLPSGTIGDDELAVRDGTVYLFAVIDGQTCVTPLE